MNSEEAAEFVQKNMDLPVEIHYKKDAGRDGRMSLELHGSLTGLFYAVCEILKTMALKDSVVNNIPSEEYVNVVCELVLTELEEEKSR